MNYLNNPLRQGPVGLMHGGRATNSVRRNLPARNGWAEGGPAYVDAVAPPDAYVDAGTGANGRADNIPAQLSENEYVIDAETVALLGDGNPDEGARKLDEMRAAIRQHKGAALAKGEISEDALPALDYCDGGYTSAYAGGGRVSAMRTLLDRIKAEMYDDDERAIRKTLKELKESHGLSQDEVDSIIIREENAK